MLLLGFLSGILSALTQSISYAFSARYLQRHHSAGWLLLYSQALMGLVALAALPFLWPEALARGLLLWLIPAWVACFLGGQGAFFAGQRLIESSKLVSLLGLKIPFLALFVLLFQGADYGALMWLGVALTVFGAALFNWTGGRRMTLRAIGAAFATIVLYSLCDLMETHLVRNALGPGQGFGAIVRASVFALCLLYVALGAVCWGVLLRSGFRGRLLWASAPFCACWFGSQVALFVCFGAVGPVYGNVLSALRGPFSVGIGVALSKTGWVRGEVRVPAAMWVRRAVAACLVVGGIACCSLAHC